MAKKKKKTTKKKVAKKTAKKAVKKKAPAKKATKKKAAKKVAKKAAKKKTAAKKVTKKAVAKKKAVKKKAPAKKVTKKAVAKKVAKKAAPKKVVKKADPKPKKAASSAPAKKEKPKKAPPVKIQIQEDVILTDAEGRVLCRVRDCDQPTSVESYCRYHYLLFWRKIQSRKKILSEGKLEKYIEELTTRYPHKYLEQIKKDFSTESEFMNAIQELEIDESPNDDSDDDYDEERGFIAEVRGGMDRDNDKEESEY